MNYLESIAYIESLSPTLEKPSLTRIRRFMAASGDCQNQFKTFHVAGTNGKGSTTAVLDSIISATGALVGRFTGPHLLRWNERFHINGEPIADHVFAEIASAVRADSEQFGRNDELGPLTWFEFLTVIAFRWFAAHQVDAAVLEVGLGGRFDATNIVDDVAASVITNIDLDHMHILGDTVELIAYEKAGIVRPGTPLVTGASGAALGVIGERCRQMNAPLFTCGADFQVMCHNWDGSLPSPLQQEQCVRAAQLFSRSKHKLALDGEYQVHNAFAATAALVISGMRFGLDESAFENAIALGMENVYWPGRLQYLPGRRLVLDGAHNPAGAAALRASLETEFPHSQFAFVVSCFENKKAPRIIDELVRRGDRLFLSEATTRRATYNKNELADYCGGLGVHVEVCDSIAEAYEKARNSLRDREIIVCTGSFATVRETMQHLGWQSVEDGRRECVKISGGSRLGTSVESM